MTTQHLTPNHAQTSDFDESRSPVTPDTPSIYVASLADYNDGTQHGVWIDATMGEDHIIDEVSDMLERSPFAASEFAKQWGMKAEEWAIHDYSGFGGLRISEWESFERIAELAQAIDEHGDAFAAYLQAFDDDGTVEDFQDRYQGEYESPQEFAAQWHEDIGDLAQVPESLQNFIDWERVAHDMQVSGSFYFATSLNYTTYVFHAG